MDLIVVAAFLLAIPVCLVAGARLATMRAPIQEFAGLLTLKPFLATPLWGIIVRAIGPGKAGSLLYLWSALPGVGLTLILVVIYRETLFVRNGDARIAWLLLALDTLRWGSTLMWVLFMDRAGELAYALSFSMPLLFAIAAWMLCASRNGLDETTQADRSLEG